MVRRSFLLARDRRNPSIFQHVIIVAGKSVLVPFGVKVMPLLSHFFEHDERKIGTDHFCLIRQVLPETMLMESSNSGGVVIIIGVIVIVIDAIYSTASE